MTTVSAVIFLVSAQYEWATTYIINRVVNGDYGVAIAYSSVLIVLMLGRDLDHPDARRRAAARRRTRDRRCGGTGARASRSSARNGGHDAAIAA